MSNKGKYILYTILDFMLTFGGTGAVVVMNYITPDTSIGYKLSFTGVLLIVTMVLVAKNRFEHTYQSKMNDYLQALAKATDSAVKEQISQDIEKLKVANVIYQNVTTLLPIAIMLCCCYIAIDYLKELTGVLEACLISMGGGAVFNIMKAPLKDKMVEETALKKVNKNSTNT